MKPVASMFSQQPIEGRACGILSLLMISFGITDERHLPPSNGNPSAFYDYDPQMRYELSEEQTCHFDLRR